MTEVRDAIAAILDTMTLEQFVAAPGAAGLVDDEVVEKKVVGRPADPGRQRLYTTESMDY